MFRIFLGAPPATDLNNDPSQYHWQTISSSSSSSSPPAVSPPPPPSLSGQKVSHANENLTTNLSDPFAVPFPVATLEAASQRISLVYKNIIFAENQDEDEIQSVFRDQTTLYTWPSTSMAPSDVLQEQEQEQEPEQESDNDSSKSQSQVIDMVLETQESDDQVLNNEETHCFNYTTDRHSYSYSYANTTSASVSDSFTSVMPPKFNFTLNSIHSLSSVAKSRPPGPGSASSSWSQKVNLLLAVLEVDGPNSIRIKRGVDAGKEASVLSLVLGDGKDTICKLTAWREVAETWGGAVEGVVGVKRGDVVFVANVLATWNASTSTTTTTPAPPTLTASPYLNSNLEICYRTMPYTHEDGKLRPDLRLESDERTRRVAGVVRWFEGIAGLGLELRLGAG